MTDGSHRRNGQGLSWAKLRGKGGGRASALSMMFLMFSSVLMFHGAAVAHAQSSLARLEVWSPDVHSSNITDLAMTPGSQFTVRVNITGAGPLLGFDVTLHYNITQGPNVLQAITPQPVDPLSGGLFDPNAGYPGGCFIAVARSNVDVPPGWIRFAAVVAGGCTVPGTGTLFSITFQATGTGSGSIDIQKGHNSLIPGSVIIGGEGNPIATVNVPFVSLDAYFQNKPGVPPSPSFTFNPVNSGVGDSVQFNATESRDTDNPSAPNGGAEMEPVVYDANNNQQYDLGEPVLAGTTPAAGSRLGAPPPVPCRPFVCPPPNQPDPHFAFNDGLHSGHWDPGDTVVYDANENLIFDQGDWIIAGPPLPLGTPLSQDPKLTYVDIHQNNFWDNGYVWDWGDGSSLLSTGNVTSHVFALGTVSIAGQFQVKLVVFDSDNGLANRKIQIVPVGIRPVHDVGVRVSLSNRTIVIGDPLGIQVNLLNTGSQGETLNLTVTCGCPENLTVARESRIIIAQSSNLLFNYTLDTSSLVSGSYNITGSVALLDPLTGAPIPDTFPAHTVDTEVFRAVAAKIRTSVFLADGDANLLPVGPTGNPTVQVVMPDGIVRSTSPGEVFVWVNATSIKGQPLRSVRITEFLPRDWNISSNRGAIHVYLDRAGQRLDITANAHISAQRGQLVISVANLTDTAAGGPLQPGESILVSVKMRYGLIGSIQNPRDFLRRYGVSCDAQAWTQANFSGGSTRDFDFTQFDALAKLPGDVNGDFRVNLTDLTIVAGSFGSTLGDANWNAAADLNQNGRVDLFDLSLVGANFGLAANG